MKLEQLLEAFPGINIKDSFEHNNVKDKNDWFYNYALIATVSAPVAKRYKQWKKENPNGFPRGFIYDWESIISDKEYNKGDELIRHESDLDELHDFEDHISWNGNKARVDRILDLSDCFKGGFLSIPLPDFEFEYVDNLSLSDNAFTEYPSWAPAKCDILDFSWNKLSNISDLHKRLVSCRKLDLKDNPIKSGALSLMRIKGLQSVALSNPKLSEIINTALRDGTDILEVQDQLLDAGLEEFAKL
jgi:hypothetical protein